MYTNMFIKKINQIQLISWKIVPSIVDHNVFLKGLLQHSRHTFTLRRGEEQYPKRFMLYKNTTIQLPIS